MKQPTYYEDGRTTTQTTLTRQENTTDDLLLLNTLACDGQLCPTPIISNSVKNGQ